VRAVQRRAAHPTIEELVGVKVLTDLVIGVMARRTSVGLVEVGRASPVRVQQNLGRSADIQLAENMWRRTDFDGI
jgi:hypothetical protein